MSGNAPRPGDAPADARFPADAAAPSAALAAARVFAGRAGIAATDAARLAVVVEELVCNIVEHGAPPAGSMIALTLARDGGRLRLTIADEAGPFDAGTAPVSRTVPERGGGAGLAIVRRWTRIERYERVLGVNRLVLTLPLAGG